MLAPITLFVYNRPKHTRDIIESLLHNIEAKDSLLYIYSDGPKDEFSIKKVYEVRDYVNTIKGFKEVIITERNENYGLAKSIISGVTEIVNKHGKIIVLEDDLILSPYFLYYMNDSLDRYEDNHKVGQIGSCNFFACGKKYPPFFFAPVTDCLGWATWKDRWGKFNEDGQRLLNLILQRKLLYKFNVYGTYDMKNMLEMQIAGKTNSWAIRWQATCVLNDWLILYPNPAFSNHIESKDATHANINIAPPLCDIKPNLVTADSVEDKFTIRAMKRGCSGIGDYYGNLKKYFFLIILKRWVAFFTPNHIIKLINKYKICLKK